MTEKDIIKVTVAVERIRFYKNEWGIIECSIDPKRIKQGTPKLDRNGIAVFKGVMPQLQEKNLYNITAEYVEDPKFGGQYNILSIFTALDFGTGDPEGQKKFLSSIYTPLQVTNMYDALKNPFQALKDKDIVSLIKVKGCGMDTADRWIRKFEKHIGEAKIYTELEEYNLTTNMIKKLMDRYNSPELVIEKVKNNPYVLCNEVKGIGWKTADKIALEGGIGEFSTKRIAAYMVHYLDESGENGCSWITPDELMGAVLEGIGEEVPDANVTEAIHELGDELWWNDDKSKIGLRRYYNIEEKIAKELIRIRDAESNIVYKGWEDTIKHLEHKLGWNFTDEQRQGIQTGLENNVTIITGGAGCVDCDTEYFNGVKWKKISDYTEGEQVLQYNENGSATLVKPIKYIKQTQDEFYHIKNRLGTVDQMLSSDHTFVYFSNDAKKLHKTNTLEVVEKVNNNKSSGFNGLIKTAFSYNGTGLPFTNDYIRLLVAFKADGTFRKESRTYRVRFNLKKERKINRLRYLLQKNNVSYVEKTSQKDETVNFYCDLVDIEKRYTSKWYNCTQEQMKTIVDEVVHWDGSTSCNRLRYYSTYKEDADFIQFACASINIRAGISYQKPTKKVEIGCYVVNIGKCSQYISIKRTPPDPIETVISKDGYEYCFVVPSHMLILRRNNNIFITGNCGKTSLVSGILETLRKYSFVQTSLSGRAASRMAEVTGQDGYTIHRLLGYPQGDKQGFKFHDENPLPYDIYIIDEISMVDAYLFYYLLRAIPSGAKLFLLGDIAQLESIGCGNIAHDMISSREIATVLLTKIHRQAAKSAIITESVKVRNGQQLIDKEWAGTETRGELQDLTLKCYSDKSNTYYEIMKAFAEAMSDNDFNIMDLQIIVPVKNNGAACTYEINNAVQEIYNPESNNKKEVTGFSNGKTYIIREGDKVMNISNNYKTSPPIYNGNIGIVKYIDYDEELDEEIMLVDFQGIGEVKVPKSTWGSIELGYACTCHKFQGSEANHVIFGLDFTSYSLLTREMIYTGITRAKKKCDLIAQTGALRMAISKEGVSKKQTHLQQCLYDVAHPKLIF